MPRLYIFIFLFAFAPGILSAQPSVSDASRPFVLGVIDHVQSDILGETRTLNIYLPQGYSPDSAATYPVIYLLDGSADEDFIHIVGIVQFLTMIDTMPKCIIVGIANVDRKRDFTFPTTIAKDKKAYPTTGGSAKFISFIERELQPYIQKSYKINSSKTIIGQSLGGLLATEILLKKPQLFGKYMIVSPSLWWDKESLLALAPESLQKINTNKIQVYIAVGNEGKVMEGDAKKLAGILSKLSSVNFKIDYVQMPDENHLTILHNAAYKAFEVLFSKQ